MDGSRERWKTERTPFGGYAYRFRFNAWFRYTLGMAPGIVPAKEAWMATGMGMGMSMSMKRRLYELERGF